MHSAESELSNCGRLQISVLAWKSPKGISNTVNVPNYYREIHQSKTNHTSVNIWGPLELVFRGFFLQLRTAALTELYIIEYLGEVETEFNMF